MQQNGKQKNAETVWTRNTAVQDQDDHDQLVYSGSTSSNAKHDDSSRTFASSPKQTNNHQQRLLSHLPALTCYLLTSHAHTHNASTLLRNNIAESLNILVCIYTNINI